MVLHHAPQPAMVLRELCRVLTAGGGVTIVDLQRHDQEWVRSRLADQWLGFDMAELENWCAAAGFAQPVIQCIEGQQDKRAVFLCTAVKKA